MIDTNYRDFMMSPDINCNLTGKLDGKILGNENKLSVSEIENEVFSMFRKVIDTNVFGNDFMNDNGVKPPEEFLGWLSSVRSAVDRSEGNTKISYYIRNFLTKFMNNRIGDLLSELESTNVKKGGVIGDFSKGELVTMIDSQGDNRFAIYVGKEEEGVARVITKETDTKAQIIIEKIVPLTSLKGYAVPESIKQNFDPNKSNLNEENLLETYVI